jgi:hypothetical protein
MPKAGIAKTRFKEQEHFKKHLVGIVFFFFANAANSIRKFVPQFAIPLPFPRRLWLNQLALSEFTISTKPL